MRVLFIVKKREEYGCGYSSSDTLGGLYNSALFVTDMLNAQGIASTLVQVTDDNDIDRAVATYSPDVVIIEALWVVPSKFEVLRKLHPDVQWVVRVHSEIPFLALEGIAVSWINSYAAMDHVWVASNATRATSDLQVMVSARGEDNTKVIYLPNWYPSTSAAPTKLPHFGLDIGCFGAIRPLKNQLIQALAALEFAGRKKQPLRFHINATRCEQQGDNVLKNLRSLFADTHQTLVEHPWENHDDFLLTMSQMDVSMTVSLSETFNLTSADAVVCRVPLVVSSEVSWASSYCFADPHDSQAIVATLDAVTSQPVEWLSVQANLKNLKRYDKSSTKTWKRELKLLAAN